MDGGDLRQIHRCQATIETTVDANKNTSGDKHFIRIGCFRKTFQEGANDSKHIVK